MLYPNQIIVLENSELLERTKWKAKAFVSNLWVFISDFINFVAH